MRQGVRIPVDNISEGGLEATLVGSEPWIKAAAQLALDTAPSHLEGHVILFPVGDSVRIQGNLQVTFSTACDRCLSEVMLSFDDKIDLYYSPRPKHQPDETIALESGELDIGWFDNGEIDLSHIISEQLALWMPDRVRCDDDQVSRKDKSNSCIVIDHEGGPELEKHSPFAGLRLPD